MFGWQAAYAQARNFEKKDNWPAAANVYEKLLKYGQAENPKVRFRLGHALFRMDMLDDAVPHLERALELAPQNAAWEYRLAFVHERRKDYTQALEHYDAALLIDPNQLKWESRREKCAAAISSQQLTLERASHRRTLQDVSANKGPAWARLDALQAGYDSHRNDKGWLKDLAGALFGMNKFEEAAECYGEVLAIDPSDADSHFMMGWAWQSCGRSVIAEKCFLRAVEFDNRYDSKSIGIGVFFQNKGQWGLAAEAYKQALQRNPERAELNFRVGLALQKTYSWQEAERFLARAIFLNPDIPMWHYRRGLSFERAGELLLAAGCYAHAVTLSKGHSQYWSYRLGQVLAGSGRFPEACDAYRKFYPPNHPEFSLPEPFAEGLEPGYMKDLLVQSLEDALTSQSGQLCEVAGRQAETAGLFSLAERAYRAAIARTESHAPYLYYRLGTVLAAQGKYEEATTVYCDLRIFKRAVGVDITPYLKNTATRKSMTYLEYAETTAIEPMTIVYESSHGASISCNPLAMFRKIVNDPRFQGYTHVWVLNDKTKIPQELRQNRDILFVGRESDLYLRYIASAKYLINNNTFPPYFTRRDGQEYLNTWHGTPIKTLGRDIKSGVMDHKNAARNFLQATHIIFPNKFTAECLVNKYEIDALYQGKLAVTGYPRIDSTIASSEDTVSALKSRLGIAKDKRVVLYAPTWRGTLANKNLDEVRLARDLEAMGGGDWHFLYRGHSVDESSVSGSVFEKYSVSPDIDTNDLLALVDVLVTDYSSIMFDFMPTRRPIVFYAYDLDEYQSERGLYFDLEDMGGALCRDLESTLNAIGQAAQGDTGPEDESKHRETFHEMESGHSAVRALEFFFFGDNEFLQTPIAKKLPNVLMYAGSFIPNGVTSSYLNLANELSPAEYNLHVAVDPVAVSSDAGRAAKFAENPAHVRAIGRVGMHLVTPDERWIIDKFNSQHNLDSEEMWSHYELAHRREFRRMFGTAEFDYIVCFEGYARFWASLFGNAEIKPRVSSIFLHSVMENEWLSRFPYLEGLFRLYGYYDQLVSVSKSASEDNARDLAPDFALPHESFKFTNNIINPAETIQGAENDLDEDIAAWLRPNGRSFVSVGRLSPEKCHLKLVAAFARVVREFDDARLVIVGDGPMKAQIISLITDLGIDNNVFMAGMRMNPYPIIANTDCFVFASDYEGQGIAILEALILGKPVISTDVTGPRSVLEDGYGLLVENTSEGLAQGMIRYLEENLIFNQFDHEVYQKAGIESFKTLVLDNPRPA
ncbi:CDP-glycerol glycerophosphotransferase family protein [Arthrobacter sp. G119Y2]|uniref:CDP-glycerol glycerophosphotransferase family protein n=1 Tax=Arthrobacter sp. G119Y2 TaxID=3134965 RepID=UPI00311A6A0D